MKINTKFNIGDHIWVVKEYQGLVSLYDDIIEYINVNKEGISYYMKETDIESSEKDLILYEDYNKLVDKIYKLMQEIRQNEKDISSINLNS